MEAVGVADLEPLPLPDAELLPEPETLGVLVQLGDPLCVPEFEGLDELDAVSEEDGVVVWLGDLDPVREPVDERVPDCDAVDVWLDI